jgi:hypothetical protein
VFKKLPNRHQWAAYPLIYANPRKFHIFTAKRATPALAGGARENATLALPARAGEKTL